MGQFARRREGGLWATAQQVLSGLCIAGRQHRENFRWFVQPSRTALATAVWTAHFDPFTSVFDADMPEDTSTFFEERFAPATAPTPVGGSSIFNQSRPAEIEAKLQQAKPLLASKLTESNAQTQLSEKTGPAPIEAASRIPRPRPPEALALQNSEPSQAGADRKLLQKLSELFRARITLASLTPNLGFQTETWEK